MTIQPDETMGASLSGACEAGLHEFCDELACECRCHGPGV